MSRKARKNTQAVLIYDGDCPICRKAVDYLKKRVDLETSTFESDASDVGVSYLAQWGLKERPDSVIVITQDNRLLRGALAIREIATEAGWHPYLVGLCKTEPFQTMVKFIYWVIAKNRRSLSYLLRLK